MTIKVQSTPTRNAVPTHSMNAVAVAALMVSVLGLVSLTPILACISVALAGIALYQITSRRQAGRELVIASLVIAALWLGVLVAVAVAVVVTYLTRPVRRSR